MTSYGAAYCGCLHLDERHVRCRIQRPKNVASSDERKHARVRTPGVDSREQGVQLDVQVTAAPSNITVKSWCRELQKIDDVEAQLEQCYNGAIGGGHSADVLN